MKGKIGGDGVDSSCQRFNTIVLILLANSDNPFNSTVFFLVIFSEDGDNLCKRIRLTKSTHLKSWKTCSEFENKAD